MALQQILPCGIDPAYGVPYSFVFLIFATSLHNWNLPLMRHLFLAVFFALVLAVIPSSAQESAYFVTYDHHLEEPGNLEIALSSNLGVPRSGQQAFFAPYLELEYGLTSWWTSELYLEGQKTRGDSTVFTGWRIENRFRPPAREHPINPVFYIEYESINEASKIQKEVVGNAPEYGETNDELRKENAHELEFKLILSGNAGDWNIAGNIIAEKNLSEDEGVEFGYSLGLSRPLATLASAGECRFCPENFIVGAELYGGLGSTQRFGLHDTAQYLAPVVSWQIGDSSALRFSPGIGLISGSSAMLVRFGWGYEFHGLGRRAAGSDGGGR